MLAKSFESPREAAAAVIEVNNAYRQKLAKASSLLKQKNIQIKQLQSSRNQSDTDNEYISKLEAQIESLLAESQEKETLLEEIQHLKNENESLKQKISAISHSVGVMNGSNHEVASSSNLKKAMTMHQITAESNKQLMIASLHIAGLDAELKAFRDYHPDSALLDASDESYEDGRKKSVSRLIYEEAFDKRGAELGITSPTDMRPK